MFLFEIVVDCPEDAELPVFYNQVQDGPEAFSSVEVICATALLPGIHGEQLQGVLWGQRCFLLHLPFILVRRVGMSGDLGKAEEPSVSPGLLGLQQRQLGYDTELGRGRP